MLAGTPTTKAKRTRRSPEEMQSAAVQAAVKEAREAKAKRKAIKDARAATVQKQVERLLASKKPAAFKGSMEHYFRWNVEAFLRDTGMLPTVFGIKALDDPTFVHKLRKGRSPHLDVADRVKEFIAKVRQGLRK